MRTKMTERELAQQAEIVALATENIRLHAEKALLVEQYQALLDVVQGAMHASADMQLAVKDAVCDLKSIVIGITRPTVVLYEGGSREVC
jgi:hypothetical protein